MMQVNGKWFDEVGVGDTFSARLTITDAHLVLGAILEPVGGAARG